VATLLGKSYSKRVFPKICDNVKVSSRVTWSLSNVEGSCREKGKEMTCYSRDRCTRLIEEHRPPIAVLIYMKA
jgi:hypothetical protein